MSRGDYVYALVACAPSVIAERERIYKAGYDAGLKGGDWDKEAERYSSRAERVSFLLGAVTARRDQLRKKEVKAS